MVSATKGKNNKDLTVLQLLKTNPKIQCKKGYYLFKDFTRSVFVALVMESTEGTQNDDQRDYIVDNLFNFSAKSYVMSCHHFKKNAELNNPDEWHKINPGSKGIEILLNKTKQISYIDIELFDKLSHSPPPHNCIISNFFASEILVIFPQQNKHDIVASYFSVEGNQIQYYVYLKENLDELDFTSKFGKLNAPMMGHISMGVPIGEDYNLNGSNCWIVSFLLWQQSMHDKGQEVIELDAPTRKMGFGKNSKQVIVPRVIGEGYKPKVIRNYDPVGTHASPRTHWRSGHWRQQPFGSKEQPKYKTIWIEPTLINA